MKSVKLTAICVLTSVIFLTGTTSVNAVTTEKAGAEKSATHTVRVGLYYSLPNKDTRIFSSNIESVSGFDIGYTNGSSFTKLFSLSSKELVIAPSGNLYIKNDSTKILYSGTGGSQTFGGYHLQLSGSYSAYSDALSASSKHKNAFVAYSGGVFVVRVGAYSSYDAAYEARGLYAGSTVYSPSSDGLTVCDTVNGRIVFEYNGNSKHLAIRSHNGGTVTLPTLSNNGYNYFSYYGFFAYSVLNKKLCVVNYIELEQYVKSVMANEVGLNASDEVTKAFSILIRTVPLRATKHSDYGFDVCNQSCCQVYKGTFRQSERNDAFVDSTKGIILTYDGEPISCQYNYSNGGASCSSAAAWGNSPLPYLTSVFLEEPADSAVTWQEVFSEEQLYKYLKTRPAFSSLQGGIAKVEIKETDPSGSDYVMVLAVTDQYDNTVTLNNSSTVRGSLDFSSSNFVVRYLLEANVHSSVGTEQKKNTSVITANGVKLFDNIGESYKVLSANGESGTVSADLIMFDGKGRGHGVGYSQVGAEALVSKGYDYAYTLSFYFPGTQMTKIK